MQTVFVAKGEVVEQILDGQDLFFGERLGDSGTDALYELDRGVERQHRDDASRKAKRRAVEKS
jgi:hypothetical protein